MKLRGREWVAVGLGLIILLVAMCASGCGGGEGVAPLVTGVSGVVVDADTLQGIGNIVVTVGGQSDSSETPEGSFTVTGVASGRRQVLVQESAIFVPVPGPDVFVDVEAGQIKPLPGPLYVIDRNNLPWPSP